VPEIANELDVANLRNHQLPEYELMTTALPHFLRIRTRHVQINCTALRVPAPGRTIQARSSCRGALRGDGPTTIPSHVLKQRGYSLAYSEVGQGTQVIRKLPDQELVVQGSTQGRTEHYSPQLLRIFMISGNASLKYKARPI